MATHVLVPGSSINSYPASRHACPPQEVFGLLKEAQPLGGVRGEDTQLVLSSRWGISLPVVSVRPVLGGGDMHVQRVWERGSGLLGIVQALGRCGGRGHAAGAVQQMRHWDAY